MDALYATEALATGEGRDGRAVVQNSDLDFKMATPKEMGGDSNGANPEQLFAAGYAACFHSALQAVARSEKTELGDSSVGARVSIGKEGEGFKLEVIIPAQEHDKAQELADAAHQVCPYSNATRGNIDVNVTVAQD